MLNPILAFGQNQVYFSENWNQDGGTSYSASHVSGVAALIYSQHHLLRDTLYPNVLSPEDVDEILKRTATPVKNDNPSGYDSL